MIFGPASVLHVMSANKKKCRQLRRRTKRTVCSHLSSRTPGSLKVRRDAAEGFPYAYVQLSYSSIGRREVRRMLKGTERPRQYRGSCQGGPSLRIPMSTREGSIQAPEEAQAHGHFVLGTMEECRRLKGQRSCGGKRRIPSAK